MRVCLAILAAFFVAIPTLVLGGCDEVDLKNYVRPVQDFPREGVQFIDIAPLLENPEAFRSAVDGLARHLENKPIEAVVALESRGFLFGAALAYKMELPLVLVRKAGKLPGDTFSEEYEKEYGVDVFEIQEGALSEGQRCVLVDDIVATGGSLNAVCRLVAQTGAVVEEAACIIEIEACKEDCQLDVEVFTLLSI